MRKIFILSLIIIVCIFSNKAGAQTGMAQKAKSEIAFITAINLMGKNSNIDADFVQMLTGKTAIKAAKKSGEAEYDINAKGDTSWYVPNDYYILNSNKKIRKLLLAPSVNIYLVKDGGSKVTKSILPVLRKNYAGKIFKLLIEESKVVRIEEIYIP